MPYGLDLLKAGGAQASGNFINESFGLLTAKQKRDGQQKSARNMQNIDLEGEAIRMTRNEEMAMRMFENTGYGAQVEQMKKAGLNPSLLYGMSAGGGTTTAQAPAAGNSRGEGYTPSRGAEGMGLQIGQMGLMKAQERNLNADSLLKETEAKKKAGVDTENVQAGTEAIKQGIINQKTQNELMGIQDSILRNELFEKYKTQDWRFEIYAQEAEQKIQEARQAMAKTKVDEATINDKIKILQAQAIGEILRNSLISAQTNKTKSDIQVNDAEINKMANDIMLGWNNWGLEERKTQIIERVGKFHSAQSQRTFENITRAVQTVMGGIKPVAVQ